MPYFLNKLWKGYGTRKELEIYHLYCNVLQVLSYVDILLVVYADHDVFKNSANTALFHNSDSFMLLTDFLCWSIC